MNKIFIYLDYHATTPVDPRVLDEMLPYFTKKFGNESSKSHFYGREASAAIEHSRKTIASYFNCKPEEVVFTSSATESINLAIKGIAESEVNKKNHIITSQIEHSAVLSTCRYLEKFGFDVTYLPVDSKGFINPQELKNSITKKTILVTIQSANNEIGTIQDTDVIASICSEESIPFLSDMTQSIGKANTDFSNIDMIAFAGHKIYGPKGVGVLILRKNEKNIKLIPQLYGGEQENSLRPSTLNTPGIIGIAKAISLLKNNDVENSIVKNLRDQLFNQISSKLDNVHFNGDSNNRLSNNLSLRIAGVNANDMISAANTLCFSSGSACAQASGKASHVLKAIGLSDDEIKTTIRLSLGRFTTLAEIYEAGEILIHNAELIRHKYNYKAER